MIEQPEDPAQEQRWPGQVFADANCDYSEAMLAFVAASHEQPLPESFDNPPHPSTLKEQKRALHQEEGQLRDERRTVRQQRHVEDAAWQAVKNEHRSQKNGASECSSSEHTVQEGLWRTLRRQQKETLAARKAVDQQWQQKRLTFRPRWSQLPIVTAWIAILVITDNCTRQCLGLPLFVAGPNVTAEMIVAALRYLLPPDLLVTQDDKILHDMTNGHLDGHLFQLPCF